MCTEEVGSMLWSRYCMHDLQQNTENRNKNKISLLSEAVWILLSDIISYLDLKKYDSPKGKFYLKCPGICCSGYRHIVLKYNHPRKAGNNSVRERELADHFIGVRGLVLCHLFNIILTDPKLYQGAGTGMDLHSSLFLSSVVLRWGSAVGEVIAVFPHHKQCILRSYSNTESGERP